jgi:hypothetical protein
MRYLSEASVVAISYAIVLKIFTPLPIRAIAAFALVSGVLAETSSELAGRVIICLNGKDPFATDSQSPPSLTCYFWRTVAIVTEIILVFSSSFAARAILNRWDLVPLSNKSVIYLTLGSLPLQLVGTGVCEVLLKMYGYTLDDCSS